MNQLSLFVAPQLPEVVTPAAQVASAAPEPGIQIRVQLRCCACAGMHLDWHTPILSVAQMQAAGWLELRPNEWATPGKRPCLRYCGKQISLSEGIILP